MTTKTKWIGIHEAVELTGQSERTIRRLLDEGEFPGAYRATPSGGSPWRIPEASVKAWLEKVQGVTREEI